MHQHMQHNQNLKFKISLNGILISKSKTSSCLFCLVPEWPDLSIEVDFIVFSLFIFIASWRIRNWHRFRTIVNVNYLFRMVARGSTSLISYLLFINNYTLLFWGVINNVKITNLSKSIVIVLRILVFNFINITILFHS